MAYSLTTYAPKSFDERGIAVPFTTPVLSQLRVRSNKDELEVVIPGFGGASGRYIVRWRDLPDICGMTIHDRRLSEVIAEEGAISPGAIRAAALRVAEAGFAGEDVQAAARAALKADQDAVMLANFALIIELMSAFFGSDRSTVMKELATPEGQRRCRDAIAAEARKQQLDHNSFLDDVTRLAGVLVEAGAGVYREHGRLRRSYNNLNAFVIALETYAPDCPSEASGYLRLTLLHATRTRDLARAAFSDIDGRVSGLSLSLRRLSAEASACEQLCHRLAFLLDGWDHAAAAFNDMAGETVSGKVDTLIHIAERLPLLPSNEGAVQPLSPAEERLARRHVRALEDWRHGGFDVAMLERIERIQSRALT